MIRATSRGFLWLGIAVILFLPVRAMGQPKVENCVACHQSLPDERLAGPAKLFKEDIHAVKGFGCVSCHGGDASDTEMSAMSPAKGYIGKPTGTKIVDVCGRCHSDARFMRQYNPALRVDQVTEYYTSVHGRRLKEQKDSKVATCATCHKAHSIKAPSDPRSSVHPLHVADTCGSCHANAEYMAPYKIPTDQLANYKKSVHWRMMANKGDLSAPTCNDCHGNHGAAPPGISWVGNVCGQCHAVNGELFNKSRHSQVFVQMGIPGCATCHDNHQILETSDDLIGTREKAVCIRCHTAEDRGGKSAAAMRAMIDSLRQENDKAHAILLKAGHAGMEVSQAEFDLNEAKTALVKARAAIHAFSVVTLKKEIDPGLQVSAKAYAGGLKALEELGFRRKWLAVSAVIILGLIVGLVFKIRQMENARKSSEKEGV
ncbi:MAG: cytochrome c3 family protein [Deltaproteobacteria bacterium]|nr:cytochrome c3 family protein [Deltaproteobacteria bacterium]